MLTCSKYNCCQDAHLPLCLLMYYCHISLNETQLSCCKKPFSICQQCIFNGCRYYQNSGLSTACHNTCSMTSSYGISYWLMVLCISNLIKSFRKEKFRKPFSIRSLLILFHYRSHRIIALPCCPNAKLQTLVCISIHEKEE